MGETPKNSYEKPLEGLSLKQQVTFLKNEVEKIGIKLKASEEKHRLVVENATQTIADLRGTIRFFEDMISQILDITPEGEEKARIMAEIEGRLFIQNQVKDRVDEIVLG